MTYFSAITTAIVAYLILGDVAFYAEAGLSAHEGNQVWMMVRRARLECRPSIELCNEKFPGFDMENCVNECVSRPCFNQVFAEDLVCFPVYSLIACVFFFYFQYP